MGVFKHNQDALSKTPLFSYAFLYSSLAGRDGSQILLLVSGCTKFQLRARECVRSGEQMMWTRWCSLERRFESPRIFPGPFFLAHPCMSCFAGKPWNQFDEGAKCGPDSARAKTLMRGAYKMMDEYVHVDR